MRSSSAWRLSSKRSTGTALARSTGSPKRRMTRIAASRLALRLGIELGRLGRALLALDLDVGVGGADGVLLVLLLAVAEFLPGGHLRRPAYCGSTSTLKLTPVWAREEASACTLSPAAAPPPAASGP